MAMNEPDTRSLLTWLTNNPVTAVSIAGGVIYMLVFESYRAALRPFGVTPAEVGVDYATAVWPVAQALAFVALTCFLLLLMLSPVAFMRSLAARLTLIGTVCTVVVVAASIYGEAQYVSDVRRGDRFEPILSGRLSILNGLRADLVEVTWKEASPAKPQLPSEKLLLLGIANGTAIIYSAGSATTWRVPIQEIVVTAKAVFPSRKAGGHGEE